MPYFSDMIVSGRLERGELERAFHARIIIAGDQMARRRQHMNVVPPSPQAENDVSTSDLIAAQLIGRVEIGDDQDAHVERCSALTAIASW